MILIVHAMRPEFPLQKLYKSVIPFVLADIVVLALLASFPQLTLWLPALLRG